jgi:hypothetical protein
MNQWFSGTGHISSVQCHEAGDQIAQSLFLPSQNGSSDIVRFALLSSPFLVFIFQKYWSQHSKERSYGISDPKSLQRQAPPELEGYGRRGE